MNLMRIALPIVLSAITVVGCRQVAGPKLARDSVPEPRGIASTGQPDGPVVGHLKTRDKLITIRTGNDGPLYTVKSEDGTVLAVDLPPDELSVKFPDLKNVVEGGIADWAGMDLPQRTIENPIDFAPVERIRTTTTIIEHNFLHRTR